MRPQVEELSKHFSDIFSEYTFTDNARTMC